MDFFDWCCARARSQIVMRWRSLSKKLNGLPCSSAGLFVLIHSLQYMGVITWIGGKVIAGIEMFLVMRRRAIGFNRHHLWVSAVVSAFLDNIPYTATMIPVVLQIAWELNIDLEPLIWALAFGACLGGNGTLIGASAIS